MFAFERELNARAAVEYNLFAAEQRQERDLEAARREALNAELAASNITLDRPPEALGMVALDEVLEGE